ncbi:uncharacterized protein LOC116059064 [Sander lucioperca]|uniref:uncharacterized protein LOC116059064 n=1 Tax=Sander lucioperca TaxID=283035 RepID=UPI00165348F8|nr:uncharacterized protein LOC116059064 [Sander lucioperca]
MYARAVWKEGEQEEEGVVPDNWIDRNKRTLRWPHNMSATKTERALRDKINPQDDWITFPLIKIKMTSAKRCECNNYNLTSQAEDEEEEDDDDEVMIRSTRKRTKKGPPDGFVRNELTDSDEVENVGGDNLPKCPTAPRKLQSIQDPNMMHAAYSGHRASSHPVKPADRSRGREMTTPHFQDASTALRRRDLSLLRSRHATRGCARDGYRSRASGGSSIRSKHSDVSRSRSRSRSKSWHSDGSRHTAKSRHEVSRHSDCSSPAARSRHDRSRNSDPSRTPARSRHNERSQHSDLTSPPPYDRPRHDAVTENGRWTFPLPWDVYQKKVLNMLVDLRNLHKQAQPASSALHIERMEPMEDFERVEQDLCDAQAFDTLVLQIARIGGKNTKVLDRYVPT